MITQATRVLCAMSGGVDSSMAAAVLQERGFAVTGVMLRFWPDDRACGACDRCCSPDAAYDARRVADALKLPFYLLDAREQFKGIVIDPFVPNYLRGETPNPCVWCNRQIKFGSLLKKAEMLGCSYLATGHFVRRVDGPHGVELHRGDDDEKDQTYFLWALPRQALPQLLFPIGELTKAQVRQLAAERGLVTAQKPSSHGLCFIPTTVRAYLQEHSAVRPGPVLDAADGYREIGRHQGVQFYTIGQRKGLGLYKSHLERYVIDLRGDENIVVVGRHEQCHWRGVIAERSNFLLDPADLPARVWTQVRYRQRPVAASLELLPGDRFALRFDEPLFAVAPGQSAVLYQRSAGPNEVRAIVAKPYQGSRLLGGGVIVARLQD